MTVSVTTPLRRHPVSLYMYNSRAHHETLRKRIGGRGSMSLGVYLSGRHLWRPQKNQGFDPPSGAPCPRASTWAGPPLSPCGRPHAVDKKYTLLISWNG